MSIMQDTNRLFTILVKCPDKSNIVIHAFDANRTSRYGHMRIDVQVNHHGKVIFPRGSLYCGVASQHAIDSKEAKRLVLELVAMQPGDTDREYFESYSDKQLAWCQTNGSVVECGMWNRFGNEIDQ